MRTLVVLAASGLLALLAGGSARAAGPLAAYWPLLEGRGQIAHDFSGNGNHGILGSTTAVEASDPTWIRGSFLSGLRFDGDDYITIADSPSLEPESITVASWFRGVGSPGQWRYIVSKGASDCEAGSYGLYTGFGGGMAFYISDGTSFVVSPEAEVGVWDGRWHFAAGTFDGTTVRLYVDGRAIGSGTPSEIQIGYGLRTGDTAQLGAYRGSCDLMLRGDIDEITIWNRALPISDIWSALRRFVPHR